MKRTAATRDPVAQIQALAERTRGWDPQAVELHIADRQALFAAGCLGANRCFETKVGSAFAAASLELQNLQLARAFEHRKQGALDAAARRYVAFEWLHYRLLRCSVKKDEQADLYGVDLGGFGFASCAAIHLGADKEARWLSREYARHFDTGYQCPFTLDKDFLRMCRWITASYLGTGAASSLLTGLYENLAKAVSRPQSASEVLAAVYNTRTDGAYKRIVLEDESETPYYGHIFPALFPFEMLAFQRLLGEQSGKAIEITHPAIAHLSGVFASGGSWQDDFVARSEARLAELEREVGVATLS